MKEKPEYQIRHEELLKFLAKFSQYSTKEGKSILTKVNQTLTVDKVDKIAISDINNAVVVFTDVLNMYSGSAGNVDLYQLMQVYLGIPEYRDRINAIVSEAKSFDYNRRK